MVLTRFKEWLNNWFIPKSRFLNSAMWKSRCLPVVVDRWRLCARRRYGRRWRLRISWWRVLPHVDAALRWAGQLAYVVDGVVAAWRVRQLSTTSHQLTLAEEAALRTAGCHTRATHVIVRNSGTHVLTPTHADEVRPAWLRRRARIRPAQHKYTPCAL